jgi:hypothetical protein
MEAEMAELERREREEEERRDGDDEAAETGGGLLGLQLKVYSHQVFCLKKTTLCF